MPTGSYNESTRQYEGELGELINNTTRDVVTVNGVQGMLFTSTKPGYEGKQLFIPFMQGYLYNGSFKAAGSSVNVWSSQVYTSYAKDAYSLGCTSSGNADMYNGYRSCAFMYLCVCVFIGLFIYLFICFFLHWFLCLFIGLFLN